MAQKRNDCSSETLLRLRSMDLFSRSRSNHYLSESERLEFNTLLSKGQTELASFHDTIQPDSTERDDLERYIQYARSLAAPIRKIPPEILGEIFIKHGTLNNISESTDIPGFNLARVSSYWRSVAFSTAALWKEIHIETSSPFFYARHVNLVQDILTRSLGSPLHIYITAIPDKHDPQFDGLHPAVPLLFEHAARWQYLRITDRSFEDGYGYQPNILEDLSPIRGQLTGLTTFISSCNEYTSLLLGNTTSLRSFSISSFDFQAINALYPWGGINKFQVRYSYNSEIVQVFPHVATNCTVQVHHPLGNDPDNSEEASPTVYQNIVRLIITMGNNRTEESSAEELLDMLTLPNLTVLAFVNEHPLAIRSKHPGRRWSATSIPSFVNRSNALLTEFSLVRTWIPAGVLLDVLKYLPTLRTLRIEEPADVPSQAPMLTAEFFQHLNVYREGRPLLSELYSLVLGAYLLSLDLQRLFARAVESRHWPLSLPTTTERVCRLDRVTLTLRHGTIDERIASLLMSIRGDGLKVSVIDAEGDIMVREWKE